MSKYIRFNYEYDSGENCLIPEHRDIDNEDYVWTDETHLTKRLHVDIVEEDYDTEESTVLGFAVLQIADLIKFEFARLSLFEVWDNESQELGEAGIALEHLIEKNPEWYSDYLEASVSHEDHVVCFSKAAVYIETLFIEPEHRRRGLSQMFFSHIQDIVFDSFGLVTEAIALIPEPIEYVDQQKVKYLDDPEMKKIQIAAAEKAGFKRIGENVYGKMCYDVPDIRL